ncbi:MAG: hypothetical protein ACKVU4_06565 [Phycisphaerales bacterium]
MDDDRAAAPARLTPSLPCEAVAGAQRHAHLNARARDQRDRESAQARPALPPPARVDVAADLDGRACPNDQIVSQHNPTDLAEHERVHVDDAAQLPGCANVHREAAFLFDVLRERPINGTSEEAQSDERLRTQNPTEGCAMVHVQVLPEWRKQETAVSQL